MNILSQYTAPFVVGMIVGASAALFLSDAPTEYATQFIGENIFLSSLVFVSLLVVATVFAPIAAFPIIPTAAVSLGPFLTGMLSIVGWTLGAVIAFLIARHAGRPVLARFITLQHIDKYERFIPQRAQFVSIVMLRMLIPVDVLSYAIGLFSSVSLSTYTLATVIGVAWFSFAFAYLGDALYAGRYLFAVLLGSFSLALLCIGWYILATKR